MSFPVQSGQTFLCIGDSITDCGRRGDRAPFGDGYMSLFRERVTAAHPELNIHWVNRGIGGNTVRDLSDRWTDDVIKEKPDWLSVKIGINDLHQELNKAPRAVSVEQFEELYTQILERTQKETSAKIVLLDPFYLSTDETADTHRSTVLKLLQGYLGVVGRMAEKYAVGHVKTHEVFQQQLQFRNVSEFCPEPVHPYRLGHTIIAHHFYETMHSIK